MNTETNTNNQISQDLKEWLECMNFILAMNGITLGNSWADTTSLRHYDQSTNSMFVPKFWGNDKICNELAKVVKPWDEVSDQAIHMAQEVEKQIDSCLTQLKKTPPIHKREVLCHMRIIPTTIAAAYLGVTEDTLNDMKRHEAHPFGDMYLGGHCYSMEELNLMARNLGWFYGRAGRAADYRHTIPVVDARALDQILMVDESVACAFTNMTPEELSRYVPHTTLYHRRYRMSELEKVRVAKLSAN